MSNFHEESTNPFEVPSPRQSTSNPWGSNDAIPSPTQVIPQQRDSYRSSSPVPERPNTPPPAATLPVMSAHGTQHTTWSQDWDDIEKRILQKHQKLSVTVSSPEIISSMMSK